MYQLILFSAVKVSYISLFAHWLLPDFSVVEVLCAAYYLLSPYIVWFDIQTPEFMTLVKALFWLSVTPVGHCNTVRSRKDRYSVLFGWQLTANDSELEDTSFSRNLEIQVLINEKQRPITKRKYWIWIWQMARS